MPTNVEVVRRTFDAYESFDMAAITRDWTPDVEWDLSDYEGWPGEKRVYRGVDEILLAFGRNLSNVRSLTVDGLVVEDLGHDRLLALYTEERRTHGAPRPVRVETGVVYTMRGGKVARMAMYSGHAAARAAAAAARSER